MRAGEKVLGDRVRRLEADVKGHELELERLRRLLTSGWGEATETAAQAPGSSRTDAIGGAGGGVPDAPEGVSSRDGRTTAGRGEMGRAWRGVELPFELGNLRRWEWWLNKVGIALLLMGVVFLFKFSWDRGWLQVLLTPTVRVCLGILLGTALVWVGMRVYAGRRDFAQVLLGGGIGTYYVTGFGAFQMLDVFSYPVAFGFMAAVTVLAFALALRQGGAALAVIGASGGFATPFLLYAGDGSVGGLVLYAGLVSSGAMGSYLFKGWRSLLVVAFVGYWVVVFTGYAGVPGGVPPFVDGLALQAGTLFGWLSLWLVPAARETLRARQPARWGVSEVGGRSRVFPGGDRALLHLTSFGAPAISLVLTRLLWDLDKTPVGVVALGLAASHALAWALLRRVEGGGSISHTQAIVALLLATISLALLLEGEVLLFVLALEAAALHLLARRLSDGIFAGLAHALFAVVGMWVFYLIPLRTLDRFFDPNAALPFLDWYALTSLAVVALAFVSSVALAEPGSRRVYRFFAHAATAGLLLCEIIPFGGRSYALVALALYALGLHVLSRRLPAWGTRGGAHALSVFVSLWLSGRLALTLLFPEDFGRSLLGPWGLWGFADLAVVGAMLASSWFVAGGRARFVCRLFAHAALLAWLWRELALLPGPSDAYVTVAWGLCGAAMFVAGLRRDRAYLIRNGVATLFLVVAKLFLWDLAELEPVWRVLLFLGFGGLFLLLSYHLRNLWNPRYGDDPATAHAVSPKGVAGRANDGPRLPAERPGS